MRRPTNLAKRVRPKDFANLAKDVGVYFFANLAKGDVLKSCQFGNSEMADRQPFNSLPTHRSVETLCRPVSSSLGLDAVGSGSASQHLPS